MRLSLRFIIPLFLALGAFAYAVVPLVDKLTQRWSVRDLETRSTLIANTVQEPLEDLIGSGNRTRMVQLFNRITQDERLLAVGFCPADGGKPVATATLPSEVSCAALDRFSDAAGEVLSTAHGPVLVSLRPIVQGPAMMGVLVLVHDMSFVARRSAETRKYLFWFFVGLGATVALITVVIAQLSWRGWVHGLQALLRGEGLFRVPDQPDAPELRPIAGDLRELIRDLQAQHGSRDDEHRVWTPETLARDPAQRSARTRDDRGVQPRAVHPRAPRREHRRSGVPRAAWSPRSSRSCAPARARGSPTAAALPTGRWWTGTIAWRCPRKTRPIQLRRVWLTPEEEAGYYYGFANEGLWPLCHIAHVRPTFRTADWQLYLKVNQAFARAVVAESKAPDPIVLVQDYHFALLPRMIREALPGATMVSFWHVPWPNPEAFAICPWREELLDGLLGSSILGFHTQFHCNNFVDTVDRLLEARVDREMFTVSYRGHLTAVKRYPISIEWPPSPDLVASPVDRCRAAVRERHALPPDHTIGIGVDRLDYTKGIEERFRAVERLLELQPRWIGKFTFIQIAAPTRSRIEQYQEYEGRVRAMAARINDRFAGAGPPPLVLLVEHHQPDAIYEYYRAADVCMVTSLHDGMNLVAKEFVAARDDDRGVLILSQFTGAARELPEAIIVNPYDTDQCADALHAALAMPAAEQRARIRLMRGLIQEFNVYRWAGRMLIDAAGTRRHDKLLERVAAPEWWPHTVADPAAGGR